MTSSLDSIIWSGGRGGRILLRVRTRWDESMLRGLESMGSDMTRVDLGEVSLDNYSVLGSGMMF